MRFTLIASIPFAIFIFLGTSFAKDVSTESAVPDRAAEQVKAPSVVIGNTRCVVCNIEIPKEILRKYTVDYNGKVYNVCSPRDRKLFLDEAERYSKWFETGVDPFVVPLPPNTVRLEVQVPDWSTSHSVVEQQ